MVPDGWKRTTLGELLPKSYRNGIYKDSSAYGTGTNILRITDFDGGGRLVTGCLQKIQTTPEEANKFKLKETDIVINRVNSLSQLGKAILWRKEFGVAVYESNMMRIEADSESIIPEFLIRILLSRAAKEYFRSVAKQAVAQCSINQTDVKNLPLLLPPLPEQSKIAKILSTWDKAIIATEQLLTNSHQQKKALMQRLLVGKQRFPKFRTGSEYKKTKYGEIPGDWKFVSLASIAMQVSKKNTGGGDFPVLSCSKHYGFVNSLDYFNKKVYSADVSGYKIIEKGCFGFPSNHIEEGSIGYQNICDIGIVSPIYIVFRANAEVVDNEYLYALLKTDHYKQIFSAATNASVDRRGSLRWDDFSKIKVQLPLLEEQRAIVSVLSATDREIEALKKKLACLNQEKNSLMQQLLTGKRRTKLDKEI